MNELQTFFSIVFGIYFAATVSASGRFWLFDTTAVVGRDSRAMLRLLVGFVGLNIAPFLYFMFVLEVLSSSSKKLLDSPRQDFGVFLAGLAGAGIYRMVASLMAWRRKGTQGGYVFYSAPADLKVEWLEKRAELRQPPDDSQFSRWGYEFTGGLIWFAACAGIFYCLAG